MKKITLLLCLSVLAFLFSCANKNNLNQEKDNISKQNTSSSEVISYEKKLDNNPKIIEKNEDFTKCMAQAVDTCQENTFSQIVYSLEDTSACKEFKNQELVQDCEDMVYHIQATKKSDKEICKSISSDEKKIICEATIISEKARQNNNIALCNEIKDQNEQDMCKMVIINKKFMNGEKDKKLCNLIKTETIKNQCNTLF